jgi:hypothetical protein
MKKVSFLAICFLAIIFGSCRNNKLIDVTVLPEPTETGAQTFGCLVDGWVYVGGRYADYENGLAADHASINFKFTNANTIDVRVKVNNKNTDRFFEYIKFTIDGVDTTANAVLPQNCTFSNARWGQYYSDESGTDIALDNSGTVIISAINDSLRFVSGVFYGIKIQEGRFDVRY